MVIDPEDVHTTTSAPPTADIATASWISRRSGDEARWSVAVFAYNEATRIRAALESIVRAASGTPVDIVVLANGCVDSTADAVRACGDVVPNLCLVEIGLADKANAWNVYVHRAISPDRARDLETHFFVDGDVTLEPDALPRLASALSAVPSANGAGGMPATGRDRDAWRQRMVETGTVAGNLYALRGRFIETVRERRIRMPVGLVGEDFFVSWLVATDAGNLNGLESVPRCVFHPGALFSFRSLSPWRPRDYRVYLRRKWRYACRALQHQMLITHLTNRGLASMPKTIEDLYREGPLPSRLVWVGRNTPFRLLAILWIRSQRHTPSQPS